MFLLLDIQVIREIKFKIVDKLVFILRPEHVSNKCEALATMYVYVGYLLHRVHLGTPFTS